MSEPGPSPASIVRMLLASPTDLALVHRLVAPDATYVSLNASHPALTKILPYAGTHKGEGPAAILSTFATVGNIWANEGFEIHSLFGGVNDLNAVREGNGEGEDVAVFGTFTYRSRNLGKAASSLFSIWCRVKAGQVVYMQFMEDTLATVETFRTGGVATYKISNEAEEVQL